MFILWLEWEALRKDFNTGFCHYRESHLLTHFCRNAEINISPCVSWQQRSQYFHKQKKFPACIWLTPSAASPPFRRRKLTQLALPTAAKLSLGSPGATGRGKQMVGLVLLPSAGADFSLDGKGRTMMCSDIGNFMPNEVPGTRWAALRKHPNLLRWWKPQLT